MGLLGVYLRHIKNFSQKAKPIYDLFKEPKVADSKQDEEKTTPVQRKVNYHHVHVSGVDIDTLISIGELDRRHRIPSYPRLSRLWIKGLVLFYISNNKEFYELSLTHQEH